MCLVGYCSEELYPCMCPVCESPVSVIMSGPNGLAWNGLLCSGINRCECITKHKQDALNPEVQNEFRSCPCLLKPFCPLSTALFQNSGLTGWYRRLNKGRNFPQTTQLVAKLICFFRQSLHSGQQNTTHSYQEKPIQPCVWHKPVSFADFFFS